MDLFLRNSFSFNKTLFEWTGVVRITCHLLLGLWWCFYQLFGLSFWRHPFTAEDPFMSKWCNATFLQICSDEKTNSSTSWMIRFSVNFHFWVKYCFKYKWLDYKNIITEICTLKNSQSKIKIITVSRAQAILAEKDIRWARQQSLKWIRRQEVWSTSAGDWHTTPSQSCSVRNMTTRREREREGQEKRKIKRQKWQQSNRQRWKAEKIVG